MGNETHTLSAERIDGDRVRLRGAYDEDVAGIVETQCDERVRRFLGGPRPDNEVRAFIETVGAAALLPGFDRYIVAERSSDQMLGTIMLTRRDPELPGHVQADGNELELTYVFRRHGWGHGYATEAARVLLSAAAAELHDQPMLIVTQSANGPSLRVAQRLTFEPVGTFEQHGAQQTLATAKLAAFRPG